MQENTYQKYSEYEHFWRNELDGYIFEIDNMYGQNILLLKTLRV